MFTSLGYVTELERAAERGKSEIRSNVDVDDSHIHRAVASAFPDPNSVTVHGDAKAGAGGLTYVFTVAGSDSKLFSSSPRRR